MRRTKARLQTPLHSSNLGRLSVSCQTTGWCTHTRGDGPCTYGLRDSALASEALCGDDVVPADLLGRLRRPAGVTLAPPEPLTAARLGDSPCSTRSSTDSMTLSVSSVW